MADVLFTIASVALLGIALCLAFIAWLRLTSPPTREYFGDQIDEERP
jgi:hypothetical protein